MLNSAEKQNINNNIVWALFWIFISSLMRVFLRGMMLIFLKSRPFCNQIFDFLRIFSSSYFIVAPPVAEHLNLNTRYKNIVRS
jgi:hypothetical protein